VLMVVVVPEVVRRKAENLGVQRWLDDLPELVAALERDWRITAGAAFEDATEAYVATATTAEGQPVVLKVIIPLDGDAARNEVTVLRLADGDGCVRDCRDLPRIERRLDARCRATERCVAEHGSPTPRALVRPLTGGPHWQHRQLSSWRCAVGTRGLFGLTPLWADERRTGPQGRYRVHA
jgi:hypothetical protein